MVQSSNVDILIDVYCVVVLSTEDDTLRSLSPPSACSLHPTPEASPAVAPAFIDALEDASRGIGERPATGSPRYAHELDIRGLRFWWTGKCPDLVFYVETDTAIEIWRLLHGARDIPEWMPEPRED